MLGKFMACIAFRRGHNLAYDLTPVRLRTSSVSFSTSEGTPVFEAFRQRISVFCSSQDALNSKGARLLRAL